MTKYQIIRVPWPEKRGMSLLFDHQASLLWLFSSLKNLYFWVGGLLQCSAQPL